MYVLLAQEVSFDYGNYGVAGALLITVAGFVAYLKHRDAEDRKERQQMSTEYHRVIDHLSSKVESVGAKLESMATQLTSAFAAEMAAERIEHRQDINQIGQLTHDLRGMAAEAVSAKELSKLLAKKIEEGHSGK